MDKLDSPNVLSLMTPFVAPEDHRKLHRPHYSQFLKKMGLDKNYLQGHGNWLSYNENGQEKRVLDASGNNGENILGYHKKNLDSVGPSKINELAHKVSSLIQNHLGEGPWVSLLTPSIENARESAFEQSVLFYKERMTEIQHELNKELNQFESQIRFLDETTRISILNNLKIEMLKNLDKVKCSSERRSYFLHQIQQTYSLKNLKELIGEFNSKQLTATPSFIVVSEENDLLEKDRHQKIYLKPHASEQDIEDIFETNQKDIIYLNFNRQGIQWRTHSVSSIAAIYVRPLQVTHQVSVVLKNFLGLLKKISLKKHCLLIFDESEIGIYRTGKFLSSFESHINADLYIISKGLTSGLASIALVSIHEKKYIEEIQHEGSLETSSLAVSANLSFETLSILEKPEIIESCAQNISYLEFRIRHLKEQYPSVIKSITGQGMILALEFHNSDLFPQIDIQSYILSSALLLNEEIRFIPSHKNPFTLFIQPSLMTEIQETEHLMAGIGRMCEAIQIKNMNYFSEILHKYPAPQTLSMVDGKNPLGMIITLHPDTEILKDLPFSKIQKNFLGTSITVEDINIQTLMLPLDIKEKTRAIQMIQQGVDYAHELGTKYIGLSPILVQLTENGLLLKTHQMKIVTGDLLIISTAQDKGLSSLIQKGKKLDKSAVAMVGLSAPSIMALSKEIAASDIKSLLFVHPSPIESSIVFQKFVQRFLRSLLSSDLSSPLIDQVQDLLRLEDLKSEHFLDKILTKEFQQILRFSSDITDLKKADLVFNDSSYYAGLWDSSYFNRDAVIIDLSNTTHWGPLNQETVLLTSQAILQEHFASHFKGLSPSLDKNVQAPLLDILQHGLKRN